MLLAAVAGVYANSLQGAFQFDDFAVIVRNPAVHSWGDWLASLPGIRPLLRASYTASWTLGGGVTGFHVFNVAVHMIATLLVYDLLRSGVPVRWTIRTGKGYGEEDFTGTTHCAAQTSRAPARRHQPYAGGYQDLEVPERTGRHVASSGAAEGGCALASPRESAMTGLSL